MSDYVGKICPYCKTEFKPDDEIVVCSKCDMPHHKDCWIENQGCTTFGCLGTIKSADNADEPAAIEINIEPAQKDIYCTKCGAKNAGTALFCSKCGNRLTTAPAATQTQTFQQPNPINVNTYYNANQQGAPNVPQNNYAVGGYNAAEVDSVDSAMVGLKSEYYIPMFQKIRTQNKKYTWNWSAFFFAPYWMFYRKMYAYGAIMFGIHAVLTYINETVSSVLSLCACVLLGLFGNYIYMDFIEKKTVQFKNMNEPYKTQFAAKTGGVNTAAAVLSAFGYALLTASILFVKGVI